MSWTPEERGRIIRGLRQPWAAGDSSISNYEALALGYSDGLPNLVLSRCPITLEELARPFDRIGLDGPFWDADAPLRGTPDPAPTLVAFTGAMALAATIEPTSHLVSPGPGVPFVVPRLIGHPDIRATLSSVDVGEHLGFVICYYSEADGLTLTRFNDWGTRRYWWRSPQGQLGWDRVYEDSEVIDIDLAPWIESGDLSWIQPGERDLILHSTVDDCPYVGLEGSAEFQRVQDGRVWTPSVPSG